MSRVGYAGGYVVRRTDDSDDHSPRRYYLTERSRDEQVRGADGSPLWFESVAAACEWVAAHPARGMADAR